MFYAKNNCGFLEQGYLLNIGTNLERIFIVQLAISLNSLQRKSFYMAVNSLC